MNVDPTYAAAMQVASADERDYVAMRHRARLVHLLVSSQKLLPASPVANEEFSVDQLMPRHFVETEESVQLIRIGRAVGKEPNPHGSVHQDHQATLCLGAGRSRRLGTSRALGSV